MRKYPQIGEPIAVIAAKRIEELQEWLVANAPECRTEQKHLDEGTTERAYWHFGYLSALQDMLRLMSSSKT
jgi:hypothetical protein